MKQAEESRDQKIDQLREKIAPNLDPLVEKLTGLKDVLDKQDGIIEQFDKARQTLEEAIARHQERVQSKPDLAKRLNFRLKDLEARRTKAVQIMDGKRADRSGTAAKYDDVHARAEPWLNLLKDLERKQNQELAFKRID
jgi:peptidoglycan hydrolase CwlO-like protein